MWQVIDDLTQEVLGQAKDRAGAVRNDKGHVVAVTRLNGLNNISTEEKIEMAAALEDWDEVDRLRLGTAR